MSRYKIATKTDLLRIKVAKEVFGEIEDCDGIRDVPSWEIFEKCLEQHKQIAELKNKCERLNQERYDECLNLQQLYSHLGVEAYGEDIQEQAIKELERLKAKETKRVKNLEKKLSEKDKEIEWLKHKLDVEYPCIIMNYRDMLKSLKTRLYAQPREIVKKILDNLHKYELIGDDFAFVKMADIDKILYQWLKEQEEETDEKDN